MSAEEYSSTELLERLQALAEELGRSPTTGDLKDAERYPKLSLYIEAFGSWNKAKDAAGLETYRGGHDPDYSEEELLEALRTLDRNTEGPINRKDVREDPNCPSDLTYIYRFGGLDVAKRQAGILEEERTGKQRYSDVELLNILREVEQRVEGPLTREKLQADDDSPSHTTYRRRFGSWSRAKELALQHEDTTTRGTEA